METFIFGPHSPAGQSAVAHGFGALIEHPALVLKGLLAGSLRFEPVQLEKNDHTGFGGITFEMMVPNSVPLGSGSMI